MIRAFAAGFAAIAAIGAFGSLGATVDAVPPRVELTVFDVPLSPAADTPTPEQLTGVLNGLADPDVPFADKTDLVEGGVGGTEASMADHKLQKAARKGELPLSFSVANIEPAGPGAVTADATVTGPKLEPTTVNVTFIDQGGWKLSRSSALSLLQAT